MSRDNNDRRKDKRIVKKAISLETYVFLGIFFLIVHFILRRICKKDGRIISIFLQSYVKEKKVYYKG